MQTNQAKSSQGELSPAQNTFLQALLQYPTVKAAADASSISERSASRYLSDPAFKAAYEQARQSVLSDIRNGLVSLASKSMKGLQDLIEDPECPHPTLLKAYQFSIERALPLTPQEPLQGVSGQVDSALLPYLTADELSMIADLVDKAQARKEQAEQTQAKETERRK